MNQTGITSVHCYNWLIGDGNQENARNRQQAARIFPLFLGKMQKDNGITRDIDSGKSVPEILAKTIPGATPKDVKRLSGLHWQRVGKDVHFDSE